MAITLLRDCPKCYSREVFQSRYRGLERLLTLFLLRPVRCHNCLQRHYRPLFYRTPKPKPAPAQDQRLSA